MNKLLLGLAAFLVFLAACAVIPSQPRPQPIACTEEAKLCPDGSAVGRVLPSCEFAPCPAITISKDACQADNDCVCGGIDTKTGNCFVGNRKYYDLFVNKAQDCPDFCNGIAGNLDTKCVENVCRVVKREPVSGTIPCTTVADCKSVSANHPDVQCIGVPCAPCPPDHPGPCAPCPKVCAWKNTPPAGPNVELTAEPSSGVMPLFVHFSAALPAVAPKDKRFYCQGLSWVWGDGTSDLAPEAVCGPVPPDWTVQRQYAAEHRYEKPGTYAATAVFLGPNITSTAVVVAVLPEPFPPECDEDNDCVPAQCCHAADCIIKEKRTDCGRIFCTQECRPGTLDCGGSCACIAGRCSGKGRVPGEDIATGPRPWQAFP